MLTILASFGCAGQYRRMAALSVVFRLTVCGRTRPAAAPAGSDWLNPTEAVWKRETQSCRGIDSVLHRRSNSI
ncbi:hypothetical protein, partial [Burkholderia vietnamiensis]|uniref:hypothetical protein n=1 Tax=Burkholderia vietnamiensis TaxID=60552 RepID=UPI000A976418